MKHRTLIQSNRLYLPYWSFLGLDALYEGGRMFVGATSVAYLLSANLSLSQIASLKAVQAITIFLGELPTGVVADSIGRRASLLAAALSGLFGFTMFFFGTGHSLLWFVIAEVSTALSVCFWSGAYEAYAIDYGKLNEAPGLLDKFLHFNQAINSIAVLIFGFIGGILALNGYQMPYLGAIICFAVISLTLWFYFPGDIIERDANIKQSSWTVQIVKNLRNAFTEGLLHPILLPIFFASISVQIVTQPILHYWQPFFQSIASDINSTALGTVFSSYCATSAVFSYLYARSTVLSFLRSKSATFISFCLFSLLFFAISFANSWWAGFTLFCLLQGALTLVRTSLKARLNEAITSSSRASILSALSMFSRIGMLLALGFIYIHLEGEPITPQIVVNIYHIFSVLSILICFLIGGVYLLFMLSNHHSKNNKQ